MLKLKGVLFPIFKILRCNRILQFINILFNEIKKNLIKNELSHFNNFYESANVILFQLNFIYIAFIIVNFSFFYSFC